MRDIIYCSILSVLVLIFYPFSSNLIWVPAQNFDIAYQGLIASKSSSAKYKINISFPDFSVTLDATEIHKSRRIIELLHEAGIFYSKSTATNPYLKVSLNLNNQEFTSELSYDQFKSNMPVQLAVSLLASEGLLVKW